VQDLVVADVDLAAAVDRVDLLAGLGLAADLHPAGVDRPELDDLAELVAQLAHVGVAPQPAVHVDDLPQLERRHVRVRVVEQPAAWPVAGTRASPTSR
jgi:hypothetical protein